MSCSCSHSHCFQLLHYPHYSDCSFSYSVGVASSFVHSSHSAARSPSYFHSLPFLAVAVHVDAMAPVLALAAAALPVVAVHNVPGHYDQIARGSECPVGWLRAFQWVAQPQAARGAADNVARIDPDVDPDVVPDVAVLVVVAVVVVVVDVPHNVHAVLHIPERDDVALAVLAVVGIPEDTHFVGDKHFDDIVQVLLVGVPVAALPIDEIAGTPIAVLTGRAVERVNVLLFVQWLPTSPSQIWQQLLFYVVESISFFLAVWAVIEWRS